MTKKQKMLLGGGVVAALVVGAVVYAKSKPAASAVPAPTALPQGTPVTTFTNSQEYTFASLLPSGATDAATLAAMLKASGWLTVQILFFGPTNSGAVPAPLQATAGGYAASGVWQGPSGAAVPNGVLAVSGVASTNVAPVATA